MPVQGDSTTRSDAKYVGFTEVELRAINPTREELNKLLGNEDSDKTDEIKYLGEDREGTPRIRLTFWLYSTSLKKWFPHSFNLTDKVRKSKDGVKTQFINNVQLTTWGEDAKEDSLPTWFTKFLNKDKEELGNKKWEEALLGQEELGIITRAALGGVNFGKPTANVTINVRKLLEGDFSEIREDLLNAPAKYKRRFVALLGVRTDENDSTKQYQQVYGKGFLPEGFMQYIENDFKGASDWVKNTWAKFEKDATGEYGFDSYYDLVPAKVYDPNDDVAASGTTKKEVTPTNANY